MVYAGKLRIFRSFYWALWFVVVPLVLASAFVWLFTPAAGSAHTGLLGAIQSAVHEQPVPIAIVAFTCFEMALWALRHRLPFSSFAQASTRDDIPKGARGNVERAVILLNEAVAIREKHAKEISQNLGEHDRNELNEAVARLHRAVNESPFREEEFEQALTNADRLIDTRYSRWRRSETRDYIESILIAILVAMGLRAMVVEAFKIPSVSMVPTLQVGDHIFVNKFVYGPAIPFTHRRLWNRMPPKRGDVIVFAFPERPEQDFIKRVIARPGDKLEVRNGHPWINGWEVPNCYVGTYQYEDQELVPTRHSGDLFVEYLGEAAFLTLYDRGTFGSPEYQGPFFVKEGDVWVMGDNRNNSHDSRMWWGGQGGGVPYENIRGRALFVWLSIGNNGVEWGRLGAPVMGKPQLPKSMVVLQTGVDRCLNSRPSLEDATPPDKPIAPSTIVEQQLD